MRESLKQDQASALTVGEQIVILLAVSKGLLDEIPIEKVREAQKKLIETVKSQMSDLDNEVEKAGPDDPLWEKLTPIMEEGLKEFKQVNADTGNAEQEDQDSPGPPGSGQDDEKPGSSKHQTV